MSAAEVTSWLERYVAAWKSGARDEIGDLFAADVRYRYHPFDEPLVGREAVVDSWLENPDAPGSFDASYSCFAADGDAAVAVGNEHVPRLRRLGGEGVRQRVPAPLRRRRSLLRVHGVVREASLSRSAASRSAAAAVVIPSASASA